ncbi:MAG: HAMP domain-containing sensor histidine kinase [Anaerolineales bacterium]|nr:HAMP domain-containing sensor histidine kinase [Anaerolineales bacterium]
MFASLHFRLWLTYLLILAAAMSAALLAMIVYLLRNPAVDRQEAQRLRLVAALIARRTQWLEVQPGINNPERLNEVVRRMDNALGVRLVVYGASGQLLADSRAEFLPPFPQQPFFERLNLNRARIWRDAEGTQWLYWVIPLEDGQIWVAATPRQRVPVLNLLRDEILPPFLRALSFAVVISLLMAVFVSHWIASPLQRLAQAARAASAGDFPKVDLEGPNEVRAVAEAFNEMTTRLQASQRAQRDLVANVSHDLKTPLTSIQGFAQALLDGTVQEPTAIQQAAQVIYDEADRMHRMVMDLLDLARLDAGTMNFERAPIDLRELLAASVKKYAIQALQSQIDLKFEIGDLAGEAPIIVVGDADRLTQVFSNLLDNALKFTPPGGQVQVSLRSQESWAEIDVADSGPGIAPQELERIFERFYQTDKSRRGGNRRGVGLGLAIAREIVQAHGGTIRADNRSMAASDELQSGEAETGRGCVFTVRLPLSPAPQELARRKTITVHPSEKAS